MTESRTFIELSAHGEFQFSGCSPAFNADSRPDVLTPKDIEELSSATMIANRVPGESCPRTHTIFAAQFRWLDTVQEIFLAEIVLHPAAAINL